MRHLPALALLAALLAGCARSGPPPQYAVFFEPWSAELDEPARGVVAEAARAARARPTAPVLVRGHASPTGPADDNQAISAKRAKAVADLLAADGVAPARIGALGLGETPVAMDTLEGRRVDIVIGAN